MKLRRVLGCYGVLFCLCQTSAKFSQSANEIPQAERRKIAIVGGGIGGTSCAYWLQKAAGDSIDIDLFNYGKIGGRIATANVNGKRYEAGASILHPENKYMAQWTEEFGLHKQDSPDGVGRMGIWNGHELVFEESDWRWVTFFRMMRRYGFDLLKLKFHITDMLAKFSRIYRLQEQGNAFDSTVELITAMSEDFTPQLNVTLRHFLKEKGYHDVFINELASAAENCNYGQSSDELNAFVGSVGLAGAVPDLWAVHGGNFQIPQKLVEHSKAKVISAKVNHVAKTADGKYTIRATDENDNEMDASTEYDAVVLALPLVRDSLSLSVEGVDLNKHAGPYQQLISTFVRGSPRAEAWHKTAETMPDAILVSDTKLFYKSLGQWVDVDWSKGEPIPTTGTDRVWKVFSVEPLTEAQLKALFEVIEEKNEVRWLAYPRYPLHDVPKQPTFTLSHGLYHVNAIEWAASAMEMSAIGGRNVALLVLRDFFGAKTTGGDHGASAAKPATEL